MNNDVLHNLIKGGLKSAIYAHGPITNASIGSAIKRISSQIHAYDFDNLQKELRIKTNNKSVLICKKKLTQLKQKIETKNKIINDLLSIMTKNGFHPSIQNTINDSNEI